MTTKDFIRLQCIFCNQYKKFDIDDEPELYKCKICEYITNVDFDYLCNFDLNEKRLYDEYIRYNMFKIRNCIILIINMKCLQDLQI